MFSLTAEWCVSLAFHSFIKHREIFVDLCNMHYFVCFKNEEKKSKEILLLLLVIKTILMIVYNIFHRELITKGVSYFIDYINKVKNLFVSSYLILSISFFLSA